MMNRDKSSWLALVAALPLALAGCVTKAVWRDGQFARFHEPANPAELHLFYSTNKEDVLVEYLESRDSDSAKHQRAYWLEQNLPRELQRERPRFVSTESERGLVPVPLFDSTFIAAVMPTQLCAVIATNGQEFTLYGSARELGGSHSLPVYEDASGRIKQVVLTPLAVGADAAIGVVVGAGVVAWYSLPYIWSGLGYYSNR